MRYVQAGFVGEGPTDALFLAPLVRRLLEEHLVLHGRTGFYVPEPVVIRPNDRWGNSPEAVVEAVSGEFSYLDLVLYHTDAAGDVGRAYRERVDVVSAGAAVPVVGVVPKREMEAWALCDGAALCAVLGLDLSRTRLPRHFRPQQVELITDPKRELRDFASAVPGTRFPSADPNLTLFGALALTLDLAALTAVPQGRRLIDDIAALSAGQGWLD